MLWPIDPWKEMERMRREMDRLIGRFGFPTVAYQFPLTNLYDGKDDIIVVAELPGVVKDDITINYHDGVLTLSGKRRLESPSQGASVLRREQPEGEFDKSIRIPVKIRDNDIKATFQDGLLKVVLPKAEEAKPKQIQVQG